MAVIAFALAGPAALAELPLTQLLDSVAGRFIAREAARGSEAAVRLLEGGAASRARLNRLYKSLKNESPELANALFKAPYKPGVMTSSARARIRALLAEELAPARQGFLAGVNLEELKDVSAVAARTYRELTASEPEFRKLLPPEEIEAILTDREMSKYIGNFNRALDAVAADRSGASAVAKLKKALAKNLKDEVPAATITGRIEALEKGGPDAVRRALGDMTLEESQLLLHGGNPLKPSADSLLGRYLSETGASTVVRTFARGPKRGPGSSRAQGPKRLVVAVSPKTFAKFKKLFSNPHLLGHLHEPQQGTLMLEHNGMTGHYGRIQHELEFPDEGTLLPKIVLKTSEAQRTTQYFELAAQDSEAALTPWTLQGYCATGGYSSCTHWFGNIPIGDNLVTKYRFPGAVDEHAYNRVPNTPTPRVRKLGEYESDSELVRRVWKTPMGNEQLADVIGLGKQNLKAELANPGWVFISLTGRAPVERVPVVFYFVRDARAKIPSDFDTLVDAY